MCFLDHIIEVFMLETANAAARLTGSIGGEPNVLANDIRMWLGEFFEISKYLM